MNALRRTLEAIGWRRVKPPIAVTTPPYTPEQLEWSRAHFEHLRTARYANGGPILSASYEIMPRLCTCAMVTIPHTPNVTNGVFVRHQDGCASDGDAHHPKGLIYFVPADAATEAE